MVLSTSRIGWWRHPFWPTLPLPKQEYIMGTDASDHSLGTVQGVRTVVVAYCNMALPTARTITA